MKVQQVAGKRVALWVLACSSICASAWQTPAPKPISGRPGVVASQGVVNFSDLARREALHPNKPPVQKVEAPERDAPPKVLPADAVIKLETNTSKPNATGAVGPPRQLTAELANSFLAEADNGTVIPPDTQGTAGPNHLVVTLNSNIVVQDRAGNNLKTVSLDNFWAPTNNSRTTDPRVVYDPFNDRWIISTSGDYLLSTSGVLVGVSQTGDPTGNWNLYKVAVDSTGLHFCDFPTLGFNKTWIAVMCNVFANASNSNSFAGKIYVFDKFDLYNHGTGAHTVFDTGGDSNVTPAITYDNNVATEYLVEEYNGNQSGMGTMRLWAINGSAGSPALSTVAFPATTLTWAENGTNNFGPQLGNATGVDTGDARIGNVIYRNGSLWTTHPVFLPCCAPTNPPNRSAIQWWQIDTSGSVLQRGLIDTPDGSYFRSYPSIAVNQYNDAVIGYARYSPNEYVGGFYSFRADTDPSSVLQGEAALKTGEAPYLRTGGSSGLNRWGDYSNTSVDPADDTSFWTIQEYAASPSSAWGTWWGQVVLPPAAFQISLTPSNMTLTAGVPLTDLAVTVVDAQGHPVANYKGTVHFTSSDPLFSMPDYMFSISENSTHHFANVTLFRAGPQSITLTDVANSVQAILSFTVMPGPISAFNVLAPTTAIHGVPFNFTITAKDAFQNTVVNYAGTAQFTSSDSNPTLPANYQFNPATDHGVRALNAALRQVGSQSISATDLASGGSVQGSANVDVIGPATHLALTAPLNVTRTKPFSIRVAALDALNRVDPLYAGTIGFTSSDSSPSLPSNYTFVTGDQGAHYFVNGVTLNTFGGQTVTATDTVTGSIKGSASINVAHLSGTARFLHVRLGKPFNLLIVADFTDDANPSPSGLSANIDWGDGSSSAGTITGSYVVTGSHTYRLPPEHPITITINDTINGYGPVSITDAVRMWPKTESH